MTDPAALPPLVLDAIELRVLHLPLVSPFTTSFGT
jgi:O-succinylbenzoate synthase